MSTHKDELLEFKQALMNIKSRDTQSVAARMCRVLQDFPKKFSARKLTRTVDNVTTTLDRTGSLFDSLWNENVGSCFACVTGINIQTAKLAIESLYTLNEYLVKYHNEWYNNNWTHYTPLRTYYISNSIVSLASAASSAQSKFTYSSLGFYLDQTTLFADTDYRPFDVYEFGKMVSQTDLITQFSILHQITDSKPWTESNLTNRSELTSYISATEKLVLMTIDLLLDMAHLIDGFSVCAAADASDTSVSRSSSTSEMFDVSEFDPSTDSEYQKITLPTPVDGLNGFTISKFGTYQLAFVVKYPYRLTFVRNNLVDLDFAPTKLTNTETGQDITKSSAIYICDKFTYTQETEVTYKLDRVVNSGTVSSLVTPYIKKIDSYGTITTDTITTAKVSSPKS